MENIKKMIGKRLSEISSKLGELGFVYDTKDGGRYYYYSGTNKVIVIIEDDVVSEIVVN